MQALLVAIQSLVQYKYECGWFLKDISIMSIVRSILLAAIISNQFLHALTVMPLSLIEKWKNGLRFQKNLHYDKTDQDIDLTEVLDANKSDYTLQQQQLQSDYTLQSEGSTMIPGRGSLGIDLPWKYLFIIVGK